MVDPLVLFIIVMALSVGFDFVNGFHDTANAIATVVATRVLTPGQAILMSASLNFVGAMTGTAVAKTITSGLIAPEVAGTHPYIIIAALLSAITWNIITWFYGIPSSSSHALIGGLLGAAITATSSFHTPKWDNVLLKVILPLIVSPVVGFVVAWLVMIVLLRLFARRTPSQVQGLFGKMQILSSGFMAFSHGSNDAQKTMGIMALALLTYQHHGMNVPIPPDFAIPPWIKLVAAIAMGLGTAVGGWRIIKTMGHKLAKLQPIHGFAAETAAATIIETGSRLGWPLSTTHVISSSILGTGASRGFNAVRWNIAGSIVTAWILTIPLCMTLASLFYMVMRVIFHLP
ncbi:low-affinity inorganic phosphate transporter 1 [Abditibacteriota bacterium]|nr:low-affinity inorganic phosphate transporter 1 [Abditibacteriota bacterium]